MKRILAGCGVLLATVLGLAAARSAPFGGGAVLQANRSLLKALDAGDEAALARTFGAETSGLTWMDDGSDEGQWGKSRDFDLSLTDERGRSFATQSADRGAATLREWAGEKATTRIVRAWGDCGSEKLGFATYELERKRGDKVQRFHATSLASYDRAAEGWRVWLLHVSPTP
jgi:hypothetical protein